eukprot:TRINITY_DN2507_c0_g1_i1.p1 TRINITY_DN2507_c0_g1~~TRINITY_DN2507_c0_g1_i1.p1  ORF type:complete len:265 (-),score=54.31 TRINITY_DN2507_c0_g1_i1:243-998(-)
MEEIENLFNVSVQPAAEIPGPNASGKKMGGGGGANSSASGPFVRPPAGGGSTSSTLPSAAGQDAGAAFGSPLKHTALTEPVSATLQRDAVRVVKNVHIVLFPHPTREDNVRALKEWDLWGPLIFIIFLALVLSTSASVHKSTVFAVVFAVVSFGAVVLTLNVLLLGGRIVFLQSLSLLGYCLFPLDVGAVVCLFVSNKLLRIFIIAFTLLWSSWAAYPFVSAAVPQGRRALAVYPVLLLYISVGFLVLAND